MTAHNRRQDQAGFTLVELIVSIVVIAVAVTGVLLAVQFTTMHSADPMIRQQQVAIADAYMEEILLREYDPASANASLTASDRPQFQYVNEYTNLKKNHKPRDQNYDELEISGLSQYSVTVEVDNATLEGADAAEIMVTVDHDSADAFTLTGYKAKY